ncbi:HEAT repeat-containing 5B-like isoform X1 [Brachionus plicatilis]|uniref:HEAT repeat-containing 5B-like isoform X1 n=1 Tax=Brachionus plicatilis TaxID=10195 RepID=A0A3M7SDG4_BRAPC|nr:HEAT repeat-containing 5B-like isoform X1 [Brachionus plicatilis]
MDSRAQWIENQLKKTLSNSDTLILDDSLLDQIISHKKRPLYLHDWLLSVATKISRIQKPTLKQQQEKLVQQLFILFSQFPGPAVRGLIANTLASLYSHGDFLSLYSTIDKCNDTLKSKDETQLQQMAKLCSLACLNKLYEQLGRTCGTMYQDTCQILFKCMKSAESQLRIEIVHTYEAIITGLASAGATSHKDIFKQLKPLCQDRNMNVRSAAIKSLSQMIKHCSFLYVSSSSSAPSGSGVSNELESSVQLGLKALDGSNFDVRIQTSVYLAQLVYYAIESGDRQSMSGEEKSPSGKHKQTGQGGKIGSCLALLANGFNKTSGSFGGFNLVRNVTLPNSQSSSSLGNESQQGQGSESGMQQGGSGSVSSSREMRIGLTYAYVQLANLLGAAWLEKNLNLFLGHVLNLVNNTKSVQSHLDAVYSRKCVQFILRSVVGGMLNEKVQLQAANELMHLIEKLNTAQNSQHILICALHELSCILRTLNTSCSILLSEDNKLVAKLFNTLLHAHTGVKCMTAWCLRALTSSLPSLMSSLLDTCMDKLSLIRNSSDALTGYGYACSALMGAISQCPLGVPSLKPKLGYNIGEELLRSASQSSNVNLAMQKTNIGWMLIGAFMTVGGGLVRKHFNRIRKLWTLTLPSDLEQIEQEKKRGDASTWQLSLESRAGALASMSSFLQNCSDMLDDESTCQTFVQPVQCAILLLCQLPAILKLNQSVTLKAQSAMYRLKLYQVLSHLPSRLYEASFAMLLSELVAEFTMADQSNSNLVTSMLRSVCHSNDSILFSNSLHHVEYKPIEDQLAPFSASGCETLEHDVTYLYQNATTSDYQSALPLGVAVIDASIHLFGQMYPKCPNKHRLQILLHFIDLIHKQTKQSNRQPLQINIFTAVLSSLKNLAEAKCDLGDEPIRRATLNLVLDTLSHSNAILRCAAGEALGRLAQVCVDSHFVSEVGQFCFDKLRNSQEVTARTGYALGLGCLHRYVGSMGAGQQMTTTVSALFAMAQSPSSSIVQVWAIHALYLIIDSGGSMFRNFIEPCVEFIVQSALTIPLTNRDVFIGLGKLLSSLITFVGPELQLDQDMCSSCLITCTVMKQHCDAAINAEAIRCLQQMHLFAPELIDLNSLVPYLLDSLVSKDFVLRGVSVNCLRQLCQKNSLDVCKIAKDYVQQTHPSGLLCLISDRGLEFLLFKMLDIESSPRLVKDIHDILYSLLSSTLNEITLKDWLFLCKDIAISSEGLSYRRLRKSPMLIDYQKLVRLIWCLKFQNFEFTNYIFVDETTIRLSERPIYHLRYPAKYPANIPSTSKYEGKLNIWAGISLKEATNFAVRNR